MEVPPAPREPSEADSFTVPSGGPSGVPSTGPTGDAPSDPTTETETDSGVIREGSPFAEGSMIPMTQVRHSGEAFYDVGPTRYMAWGAVFASALVLLFAAASAFYFPAGALVITALGAALGAFGLASPQPKLSLALATMHVGLLLYSFSAVT